MAAEAAGNIGGKHVETRVCPLLRGEGISNTWLPPMSLRSAEASVQPVLVQLDIGLTEPPCGTLTVEGVGAVAFSGWLDLLRVLSEALARREQLPLDEAPAL